ncbi:hypothetical protein SKAU_G00421950 [Synaphobranchus kaupii]|uniref:Uncharacterized protein n=1 Tax=Synaphobranchus kaupii TaxID=118154 RepID=A0A9Q1IB95_SYNKA|nr:hypothetical protein SKAU_G00421950 [Synaphobranchus kaupii]
MNDDVSDDSSDSPDGIPGPGSEPFQVRRLSSRNLQLPPLAFRLAEQQMDWDRNTERPPRPTSLALRSPPLIAITTAENSSDTVMNLTLDMVKF